MGLLDRIMGVSSKASAFGRLALADSRIQEAQGKMIAIQDSINAKHSAVAELSDKAKAIHEDHDDLDSKIDDLHALLG